MAWYSNDEWRPSLCMVQYKDNGDPDNFYRLADYEEQDDGSFILSWIDEENRGDRFEDPWTLYSHALIDKVDLLDSDFIILDWLPNFSDGKSKPRVRDLSFSMQQRLKKYELFEVVDCRDVRGQAELRAKMQDGIPFAGKSTARILFVFSSNDDKRSAEAVLLRSSDLKYDGRLFSLKSRTPGSSPSVDIYQLDYDDIYSLPLQPTQDDRYLYMSSTLPNPVGKMSIRSFEDYAADYVKWFYDRAGEGLTRVQRREISSFVEGAFKVPERLEDFIGATLPREELADIVDSVQRIVHPESDTMSKLVASVLENDETFRNECRQKLLSGNDPEMMSLRAETTRLSKERDDAQSSLNVLLHERDVTRLKIDECKKAKSSAEAELHNIEEQKDQLLQRLNDDVALRLGLQAVVSNKAPQSITVDNSTALMPSACAYAAIDGPSLVVKNTVSEAFAANLKQLGYKDANGQSIGIKAFASGVLSSLSATNMLAIDSSFAVAVANALSVALNGQAAMHVSIPESYSDAEAIARQCESNTYHVLVLDNVLDTLNEGMIFALSRLSTQIIFILPIGARGNLRLLAPEAWEHVFYVPTENFACIPVRGLEKLKMYKSSAGWEPVKPSKALYDDLSAIESVSQIVPIASWYIPLAIADVIEKTSETDDSSELLSADEWLCLHLLLVAYGSGDQKSIDDFRDSMSDSRWNVDSFMRRLVGNRNVR